LNERYSKSFSDFLCGCLKFDYKQRQSIKNLAGKEGHPWLSLRNKERKKTGFDISLKELLGISGG